jgi:hypothetical protein
MLKYFDFSEIRFEVITALKMSMLVFWVVTTLQLVGKYRRFGVTSSAFKSRNVGIYVQVHVALLRGRRTSVCPVITLCNRIS